MRVRFVLFTPLLLIALPAFAQQRAMSPSPEPRNAAASRPAPPTVVHPPVAPSHPIAPPNPPSARADRATGKPEAPKDLFLATPGTYRPHDGGTNSGRRARPDGPHYGHGGGSPWPFVGSTYWPGYFEPGDAFAVRPAEADADRGGRLQLRIVPGNALVFIDGLYEGTADALRDPGVPLRAGSHRVRVEAPGYAAHTFDVRVTDEETVTYHAALDDAPSSRPAATPAGHVPETSSTGGSPRTLYVIPLCYAGDTPPDPSTRCDLTQLRTIR